MAIQVSECEHASGVYRVTLPEEWWTNPEFEDPVLGPTSPCQYFGPEPFAAERDRQDHAPVGTAISIDYVEGSCIGFVDTVVDSRETTVDGLATEVYETAWESTAPPHLYWYVVYVTESGPDCDASFISAATRREFAGDYDENKAVLDELMRSLDVNVP